MIINIKKMTTLDTKSSKSQFGTWAYLEQPLDTDLCVSADVTEPKMNDLLMQ